MSEQLVRSICETFYQDFGDQTNYTLIQDLITAFGNDLTAADIWNFADRNLTSFEFDNTSVLLLPNAVTNSWIKVQLVKSVLLFPNKVTNS